MKLRTYQLNALKEGDKHYAAGVKSVLFVGPTGCGKGTILAEMIKRAVLAGERVLLIVHRREIADDMARRIADHGVSVGKLLTGHKRDWSASVQVASVQTLARISERTARFGLTVVDEAHHYRADEWQGVLAKFSSGRIAGFTATPQRADGKGLGDVFSRIVDVAKNSHLLELGYTVPCRIYRPVCQLGKKQQAMGAVAAYLALTPGEIAFCFTSTVAEAEQLNADFLSRSVRCEVVHAKTPRTERARVVADFAQGKVRVLANVGTMTEGVDVPAASTVILTRACKHHGAYLQMVGRVLRAAPGKKRANLLDLTGASFLHGAPSMDRSYSLKDRSAPISVDSVLASPNGNGVCAYEIVEVDLVDAGENAARLKNMTRDRLREFAKRKGLSSDWMAA